MNAKNTFAFLTALLLASPALGGAIDDSSGGGGGGRFVAGQTETLAAAATDLTLTSSGVVLTCDAGGNSISTISGGVSGEVLILTFVDALCTFVDDGGTPTADSLYVGGSNLVSAADGTLTLKYNGTSWHKTSDTVSVVSFNGDLNGSDITDSSDNIVTIADPAEFDSTVFFDNAITLDVNAPFYLGHSNTLHGFVSPNAANGELVLALGTQLGRQLVLTDRVGFGDGDHGTQANPTLFIHSVTDPDTDNREWISFTHDQTDAVIGFDTGRLRIDGGELELTNGILAFTEATTPTAVTGQGRLYTKTDDFLYFQSGDGVEHIVTAPAFKSYSHTPAASGTHWMAGFYDFEATDANLTQASLTVTLGAAADGAVGAHVVIVAGGAGTTDAGAPTITVTGASINETGTLNLTDSEELVADVTLLATNQMIESTKKWLGQVTITLAAGGGTTFAVDFNYGFAKYEDAGGLSFEVSDFECVGEGGATDTGLDIELLQHNTTGWTYAATGFVPGNGTIASMLTDYTATYAKTTSGAKIAYKRSGLGTVIGAVDEGVLVRLTTATNNSIESLDCHIGAIR